MCSCVYPNDKQHHYQRNNAAVIDHEREVILEFVVHGKLFILFRGEKFLICGKFKKDITSFSFFLGRNSWKLKSKCVFSLRVNVSGNEKVKRSFSVDYVN